MHARTWLSLLSLPLVAAFTLPVIQQGNAPKPSAKPGVKAPQDPLAGMADIQDVLSLVQQNYVDAPDMEKVVSGGIQAVLERSHPLNAYLSAEELRLPDPGPAEAGLVVIKRQIYASVLAVTPGGPAAKAGIQAGDVIRKVDGDSVGRLSAWALERKLRGPVGTSLDLYRYNATRDLTKTTVQLQLITPGRRGARSDSPNRPRIGIVKFASCDGCQLTILNMEDELLDLASVVDIAYFIEPTRAVKPGPYDIGIVEGSITTPHELERIKEVIALNKRGKKVENLIVTKDA